MRWFSQPLWMDAIPCSTSCFREDRPWALLTQAFLFADNRHLHEPPTPPHPPKNTDLEKIPRYRALSRKSSDLLPVLLHGWTKCSATFPVAWRGRVFDSLIGMLLPNSCSIQAGMEENLWFPQAFSPTMDGTLSGKKCWLEGVNSREWGGGRDFHPSFLGKAVTNGGRVPRGASSILLTGCFLFQARKPGLVGQWARGVGGAPTCGKGARLPGVSHLRESTACFEKIKRGAKEREAGLWKFAFSSQNDGKGYHARLKIIIIIININNNYREIVFSVSSPSSSSFSITDISNWWAILFL